jgi:excisionase family DNA binding protein
MQQNTLTVSAREAGEILGVGVHAVYRAIRERRLPVLRVGPRKVRVPRRALEDLMADPGRWGEKGSAQKAPRSQ